MEIEITKADITELKVEAIVNPANSMITMGGGLAKHIHEVAFTPEHVNKFSFSICAFGLCIHIENKDFVL